LYISGIPPIAPWYSLADFFLVLPASRVSLEGSACNSISTSVNSHHIAHSGTHLTHPGSLLQHRRCAIQDKYNVSRGKYKKWELLE
jgi:hypothetical protein